MYKLEESQYWLKFFRAAGLSENEIGTYSILFTKHRIHQNMLGDLSKEYLNDIGITAMGDVIAILKCAKTVIEGKQKRDALKKLQNSTPAGRTLSHHLHASIITNNTKSNISSLQSKIANNRSVIPTPASSVLHQSINGFNRSLINPSASKLASSTKSSHANKPVRVNSGPVSERVSTKGKSGPVIRDNVPVPVKRFVAPEHEGRYVINLPKGVTPKTDKILKLLAGKIKTMETTSKHKIVRRHVSPTKEIKNSRESVFSRLGGSYPLTESNSSNESDNSEESEFEISDEGAAPPNASVFSRLGASNKLKRSNSSAFSQQKFENFDALPKKRMKTTDEEGSNSTNTWMPDESDGCFIRTPVPNKPKSIHQRLGSTINSFSNLNNSSGITRSVPPMISSDWPYHHTAKVSAKNRLG